MDGIFIHCHSRKKSIARAEVMRSEKGTPLATEWKMHSGELEDRREQLEVDWSHPREMTRVYSPVRQREERRH